MSATQSYTVTQYEDAHGDALLEFVQLAPLQFNDFASLVHFDGQRPTIWLAWLGSSIAAAAIDDGLAMTVAGVAEGVREIAAAVPNIESKLVVSGRTHDLEFVPEIFTAPRTERHEFFMGVYPAIFRDCGEGVPLRIAEASDLPKLVQARVHAMEDEYGIVLDQNGRIYRELSTAVARAVTMRGVAIWLEEDKIAFTAQLISKTQIAASFGDLFTDRELRGRGLATKGLSAFCSWLFSESQAVTLRVGQENTPAVRLYERVGFSVLDNYVTLLSSDVS